MAKQTSASFREWIKSQANTRFVSLFEIDENHVVQTQTRGSKRLLKRSAQMERATIQVVDEVLADDQGLGLLYIMGWGPLERFRPLYVGMTRKKGRKNPISANLVRLASDKGKFARWGDGLAYHVGDLSQALFNFKGYKGSDPKYRGWAEVLFADQDPPRLREPVNLLWIPWGEGLTGPSGEVVGVPELEDELIDLGLEEFEDSLLNVKGEAWWAPAVSAVASAAEVLKPRQPTIWVESDAKLREAVEEIARHEVVGLDVETELYKQTLALVQVALPGRTYLIDALGLDVSPLGQVFENEQITKVIHNASFERRVLGENGVGLEGVYDTLRVSRRLRPGKKKKHGLGVVCERELGLPLDKGQQRSNWLRRPLTQQQLDYAALDAEVLLNLHDKFEREDPKLFK